MYREKEALVEKYFQGWITKDRTLILSTLGENIYVEECYGPCYRGKEQVSVWLDSWFKKGSVLSWDITQSWYDEKQEAYICKWIFSCVYKGNKDSFSGTSIISFDGEKIQVIEEFQSPLVHQYPF